MYNEILVPTDGSAAAGTATETALDLAQRFDASLTRLPSLNWTSLRLTLNRKLLRKELNAGRRR